MPAAGIRTSKVSPKVCNQCAKRFSDMRLRPKFELTNRHCPETSKVRQTPVTRKPPLSNTSTRRRIARAFSRRQVHSRTYFPVRHDDFLLSNVNLVIIPETSYYDSAEFSSENKMKLK